MVGMNFLTSVISLEKGFSSVGTTSVRINAKQMKEFAFSSNPRPLVCGPGPIAHGASDDFRNHVGIQRGEKHCK